MTSSEICGMLGWPIVADRDSSDLLRRIMDVVDEAESMERCRIADESQNIIKRAEARGAAAERAACLAVVRTAKDGEEAAELIRRMP